MGFVTILQFTIDGLMLGTTYALVAIGLTMIFGMMGVINFAHGELYMLGAVFAYYLISSTGMSFFPALCLVIIIMFIVGIILDRLLIKRIRKATHLMSAAVTIGLAMFLMNSALLIMGVAPKNIPLPFETGPILIGDILLAKSRLFSAGLTVAVIVFTTWMMKYTRIGKAMRATIQDDMAAKLVGIKTEQIYSFSFAYGSVLAAVAGVLLGSMFIVNPFMGETMITKAWTLVIVGGLGNIPGAIFAGLLIGVVESLTAAFWNTSWANLVAFVIVVLVLLIRPQGLFNKKS
jgi:branched-chain amino acid transport system permease protein